MSKHIETLKLALDALETELSIDWTNNDEFNASAEKMCEAIAAIKETLAQPEQEPVSKYCCHLCFNKSGQLFLDRMILCFECGNKRCPKATSHELPCTNSNEPNQAGSIYTAPPQRTWVGLTDQERQDIALEVPMDAVFITEAKLKEKNT